MREKETYARMEDPNFQCDPEKMEELDNSYFTSLIVRVSDKEGESFFKIIKQAYEELSDVVQEFYSNSKVEIYFDSAHITIKSIVDFVLSFPVL